MNKENMLQWLEDNRKEFIELEKKLWNRPELAYREFYAVGQQKEFLAGKGFTICDAGDHETAFYAEYGSGKPVIAVLGEYDALPGMSQEVCSYRSPIEGQGAGHACGHNLIGTAGVAAVCAIKEAMEKQGFSGTIRYYGCPAEEEYSGKIPMLESGCFNDVDCSIIWHPQDITGVSKKQYYSALSTLRIEFKGETGQSVAAQKYGGSALHAVELTATGIQYLREFIWDYHKLNYCITKAGERANLIPETTELFCTFRTKKKEQLKKIQNRILEIAGGAAVMSGTDMHYEVIEELYNDLENTVLVDVILANMEEMGRVEYTPQELQFSQELAGTLAEGAAGRVAEFYSIPEEDMTGCLHTGIVKKDELIYLPSDDAGNISWMTPFGTFLATMTPVGMPMHCWQATALSGSTIGEKCMMYAAGVMAGSVYDLFNKKELLPEIQKEFVEKTGSCR